MSRCDVRFTPKSGHYRAIVRCPLCAKSGLMHFSKMKSFDHDSITSSAWVNVDPALPVDARQRGQDWIADYIADHIANLQQRCRPAASKTPPKCLARSHAILTSPYWRPFTRRDAFLSFLFPEK